MPTIIVPKKPILKSKTADFGVIAPLLAFSKDHKECQIEISKGAGIQPIKAIKKAIPTESLGDI